MEIVTKIAPICLALIMFGLGLGLTKKDFLKVIKTPRDFLVGFFSQADFAKSRGFDVGIIPRSVIIINWLLAIIVFVLSVYSKLSSVKSDLVFLNQS